MGDQYQFKTSFEPILLPGETAHIITEKEAIDVKCVAVGALPEYQKDFGAVTAAAWLTDKEDTNLEMSTLGFSQLRMRILDDMKLRFKNLGSTTQWRTGKTEFYLRKFPTEPGQDFLKEFLFKASEFFIFEDDTPRFEFYSDVAIATSRVIFSGWRFRLAKLLTNQVGKVTIWVSGWPSGASR